MANDSIKKLAKKIVGVSDAVQNKKLKSYDTSGVVRRIEGNTAYIHFPGGIDETPVEKTINAYPGDTVQIRVSGGKAFLVGNATAPPTDNRVANVARRAATNAVDTATKAEEKAVEAEYNSESALSSAESAVAYSTEAKQIAGQTNQYFWHKESVDPGSEDETGAHITEVPQEEWEDPNSEHYHSGGNLLARSNGIAVRDGLVELASFTANDGIIIGKKDEFHVGVNDAKGLSFYKANETTTSAHISAMDIQGNLGLFMESYYAGSPSAYYAQIFVESSKYKSDVTIVASKTGGASENTAAISLHHDGIVLVTGSVRGDLETITPSITASKGTLVSAGARRFGQVVQLWIQYRNTSSTASGANIFEGTLNTTGIRPALSSSGVGYYGAHAMVGYITSAGAITIRNASSSAVSISSTGTSSVSLTYLVN